MMEMVVGDEEFSFGPVKFDFSVRYPSLSNLLDILAK
jgi:hypothetical protein